MATLVKDPITGAMTPPDGSGRTITDLNGGTQGGTTTTPADKFNLALMGILRQAQGAGSNAPLYASEDQLQNEKLNLSNPLASTPYAPIFQGMGYASTAAEKNTQDSFNPGITSIESQIRASNDANDKFTGLVNAAETIAQNSKNYVAPGQSIVDNSGNVIYGGHSYTPTANPTTGTIDGFDQVTGQWLSDVQNKDKGSSTPPAPGSNVIVGGVDLSGASTGSKPYATDPNYTTEVNGVYQNLQKGMPVPNAPALDSYIQGHAKGSSVTGSMIMNAATTYGIDPTLLASVLAQESDFGTAGLGAKTNNPGNVGNTDNGVSTSFASMQKGVNAAAMELAKRMPGNASAGKPSRSLVGSTTGGATGDTLSNVKDPVGGTFSTEAATRVAQIPKGLQSYVFAGPQGVAYVDSTKVPAEFQTIAAAQASKAGIPYVDSQDVKNIKAIGQVYQALANVQSTVNSQLGDGVVGGAIDIGKSWIHQLSAGNVFPALSAFNTLRQTAISAIQALNGGDGSGLRLNAGEIASALDSLPADTDTIKNADTKINAIMNKLNTAMAANFPYTQGSQPGANGPSTIATTTPATPPTPPTQGITKSGISYTVH